MAVPVFILCTFTKAFWIIPQFIVLECCVLPLSDYIIIAVLQKLPLCAKNLLLENVNGITYNLAHAQVTLFRLVPLVIQFWDLTQIECIHICFFALNYTLIVIVFFKQPRFLINIFTRTFVSRLTFERKKYRVFVLIDILQYYRHTSF